MITMAVGDGGVCDDDDAMNLFRQDRVIDVGD